MDNISHCPTCKSSGYHLPWSKIPQAGWAERTANQDSGTDSHGNDFDIGLSRMPTQCVCHCHVIQPAFTSLFNDSQRNILSTPSNWLVRLAGGWWLVTRRAIADRFSSTKYQYDRQTDRLDSEYSFCCSCILSCKKWLGSSVSKHHPSASPLQLSAYIRT